MDWTISAVATVVSLAALVVMRLIWERQERSVFVASLSPGEVERLQTFESFAGNWRDFRDLRLRERHRSPRQRLEHHE